MSTTINKQIALKLREKLRGSKKSGTFVNKTSLKFFMKFKKIFLEFL